MYCTYTRAQWLIRHWRNTFLLYGSTVYGTYHTSTFYSKCSYSMQPSFYSHYTTGTFVSYEYLGVAEYVCPYVPVYVYRYTERQVRNWTMNLEYHSLIVQKYQELLLLPFSLSSFLRPFFLSFFPSLTVTDALQTTLAGKESSDCGKRRDFILDDEIEAFSTEGEA